jgi:L-lactate dehydrogenase (cytochrome)
MIGDRKITDRNFIALAGKAGGDDLVRLGGYVNRLLDPSVSWKDLEWIRQTWGGPFGLKGIMTPEDARIAVDHSVDFIVVSNHGGRQQDYVDQSVIALPSIVEAVDGRCEILLDSGVRRGADVVKAVALGARACLVGRPYLFGLAAGGGPGVARALEIFRSEIDRTLALVGCPNVAQLNRSYVRLPRGAASATGVTPRG